MNSSDRTDDAAALPPVAVLDVDGVVADVRHRLHHLDGRRDWDAFFAAAADDPVLAEGVARARDAAANAELVWLTGRPEHLREVTHTWLGAAALPVADLVMRATGDRRPARIVKLAAIRRMARNRTITVVVDDDAAVVDALVADGWPAELATWMPSSRTLRSAQERRGRT